MNKMKRIVCGLITLVILCVFCICAAGGEASGTEPAPTIYCTPTPSPTPSVTPTMSPGSFQDHIKIWYSDYDVRYTLPIALIYSREGGMLADGILMFTPMEKFLEKNYEVPTAHVGKEYIYNVWYDGSFIEKFDESATCYRMTEDGYVCVRKEDGEPAEPDDLEPGEYLLQIQVFAESGENYYRGAGFLRILLTNGAGVPTPTPVPEDSGTR